MHSLLFDGGMWDGQIEPLSALGRVINIDGPGHGKSEPPPRFMLEEHADAILDAMGDLGVARAMIVGLSWGGMIGMRLALQHPEKVAGLALLDTSAEREPFRDRLRYRAFCALHGRVGMPYSLFLKDVAPKMFSPRVVVERPDLLDLTYRRTMGFDREGVARAAVAVVYHRTDILGRLGSIDAPTLVMVGAEDRATPPERAENIARAIRGARLVKLEGLGHVSTVEDPDAVNTHLVPFVRSVVLGGESRRPASLDAV
ncbi:MAG: alpha/beta fold hydrolase [Labilithrix sp.]|nr:alpha/beta fold hydrolase [Labilithrix sp.]